MKIAEVVCVFPPYKGGTGKVALDNAFILSRHNYEVTVFTPYYKKANKPYSKYPFKLEKLIPFLKYGNAAFLPQLIFYLRNFDIIHLHYPFFGAAEIIALAKKIGFLKGRIIITYHQDADAQGWLKGFFQIHYKYITPLILKMAEKIMVSSKDYVQSYYLRDFFQKYPEKFFELPFGTDLDFFQPRERPVDLMKKYNIHPEEKVILFVGGLDKSHYFKGVDNLIKAFYKIFSSSKIPVKLIIAGEGDLRFQYEQTVFDFGLRDKVIFTGSISDNELKKIYNLADVLVLPSINKGEAFGIVLIEAMASGVPVVASALPGVRTVFQDKKSGFLVRPGDVDDLKEKILKIITSPKTKFYFK